MRAQNGSGQPLWPSKKMPQKMIKKEILFYVLWIFKFSNERPSVPLKIRLCYIQDQGKRIDEGRQVSLLT